MTHGRSDPHCDACGIVGYPPCDRCGFPVAAADWVHAHGDTFDPPGWWHSACWAVRMRELDPFTGGIT
jgi:hypothetical protein